MIFDSWVLFTVCTCVVPHFVTFCSNFFFRCSLLFGLSYKQAAVKSTKPSHTFPFVDSESRSLFLFTFSHLAGHIFFLRAAPLFRSLGIFAGIGKSEEKKYESYMKVNFKSNFPETKIVSDNDHACQAPACVCMSVCVSFV